MNTWKPYPQEEPSCPARQRASAGLRHSGGFTLIELMIAVAIVGILSSLAAPNYLDFIERARVARSVAELHMIAEVVKGYAMTSGQYPDTLAQAGQNPLLDPWGNPYQYYRIDCGTNIMIGHLSIPIAPARTSAGQAFPVSGSLRPDQAHVSFANDDSDSQGLVRLIAKGGSGGGSGSSSGGGKSTCGSGKPRKDHFLHPITSDFDLYSMGKDGDTVAPLTAQKSHDDVIRASDGAYYGLAKNF